MNTGIPVFGWIYVFISFEYIARNGIAGSYGNSIFKSLLFVFTERLWTPGSGSFLIWSVLLHPFLHLANTCCVECLLCTWLFPGHCSNFACHWDLPYDPRGQRAQLFIQEESPRSGSSGLCIAIHSQTIQLSSFFTVFCNYRSLENLKVQEI